jgi:hypothetical protein
MNTEKDDKYYFISTTGSKYPQIVGDKVDFESFFYAISRTDRFICNTYKVIEKDNQLFLEYQGVEGFYVEHIVSVWPIENDSKYKGIQVKR